MLEIIISLGCSLVGALWTLGGVIYRHGREVGVLTTKIAALEARQAVSEQVNQRFLSAYPRADAEIEALGKVVDAKLEAIRDASRRSYIDPSELEAIERGAPPPPKRKEQGT